VRRLAANRRCARATLSLLILANQNGAHDVLVYRIDLDGGALTRGSVTPVGGNPTFTGAIDLR
jgi:hypothetical protein